MKITIVGLLPRQHRIVTDWYPNREFQFVAAESIRKRTFGVGKVVYMRKFINHRISEYSDRNSIFCDGGMSQLREVIKNL